MIKKTFILTGLHALFIFSMSYGSGNGLKGKVVDNNNKPIKGALVKLIATKQSKTTDSTGGFFLEMKTASLSVPEKPVLTDISFRDGILSFIVSGNREMVHIEAFDNKGQRVNKVACQAAGKGEFTVNILPANLSLAMYFLKVTIGDKSSVYKILNIKNRAYSLPCNGPSFEYSLFKRFSGSAKVIDTLAVSKDSFQTAQVNVTSYNATLSDIVLKKNNADFTLPTFTNGKPARTTRYWDCCKPHCGWHSAMRMCDINGKTMQDNGLKNGCEQGGVSFQCWDYAPIEINDKVAYAWAAFNNSGTNCGDCYQLAFQGALAGKQMIVQMINIGNGGTDAFDLLIPGGGVGAMNGCSRQWNNAPLGAQYGGFHSTCGDNATCIRNMCQAAFGDKPDLMRGCDWYLNWFKMTNNPDVTYIKVSCPKEIKDISGIGN